MGRGTGNQGCSARRADAGRGAAQGPSARAERVPECRHGGGWHKGHQHEQRRLAVVILKA